MTSLIHVISEPQHDRDTRISDRIFHYSAPDLEFERAESGNDELRLPQLSTIVEALFGSNLLGNMDSPR